jgi:hypothetical protein
MNGKRIIVSSIAGATWSKTAAMWRLHRTSRMWRHGETSRRILALLTLVTLLCTLPKGGMAEAPAHVTTTWILQGHVYEGEVGDQSVPLPGVTVAVYGASGSYPTAGTFIRDATTDAAGWYYIDVYDDDIFAYNHIYLLETDPDGYTSVGATTVSGTVRTGNWIEYALPLDGKTLTGNKFWDQPETSTWVLQGRVYEGEVGDESMPLEGVAVSVYGANNPWPDAGQVIISATTNVAGWYGLEVPEGYDYYHIRETDPHGYVSVGATTVSGTVRTENWIELESPLEEKTRTGNKFWDRPEITEPDLVVTDVWSEGGAICYQLQNVGSAAAPDGHSTALHVDGAQVISQSVGVVLEPNARWEGCFAYAWTCTPLEDHVIVGADHMGVVAESEEGNNMREEFFPCDDVPPQITAGPLVVDLGQDSARVWWTTSEPCDSLVRYGRLADAFDFEKTDPTAVLTHEVSLTGLDPSATYHFAVRSADANANTVESRDGVFETLPESDDVDPDVFFSAPDQLEGMVAIEADASDNIGVEKVEFLLDDMLLFTDYSPPYVLNLDTALYTNGEHILTTRVVDLAGRTNNYNQATTISNLSNLGPPAVTILSPAEDATVSGNPITVTANVADDLGLVGVSFFVYSGTLCVWSDAESYSAPYPTQTQVSFAWNTYHDEDGDYYISVQAVDQMVNNVGPNFTTANLHLTLKNTVPPTPPQYPWLKVTKHSVTRVGNLFTVEVQVKNSGNITATNIEIVDGLKAFQPISTTAAHADFETEYNPATILGYMRIKPKFDIPPGGTRIYTYNAVPVLYYPNPPAPAIGSFLYLEWESPTSQKVYGSYDSLPVAKTTGGQAIAQAHSSALQVADYLLVTDPYRLFLLFAPASFVSAGPSASAAQVNQLLSAMAELARYRNGVLGFYTVQGSPSAATLKNLLQPAGAWGKKMGANFTSGGYLLIVGEKEIVGSWISKGWNWGDGYVYFTDQPFGNTGGDEAPEIAVSRVVGNAPISLTNAIENSLGVIKGTAGYSFDRSHALLVSGTGDGQDDFVDNVNAIAGILGGQGITVNKLHWKDYPPPNPPGKRLKKFRSLALNRDIIFYRDHAGVDVWGDEGELETDDFPVDFSNTNPFVYASACLAGNYENHRTYNGGDYNIVEAFFDSGAAVYLGSTEPSPRSVNSEVGKKVFTSWAGSTSATVGKTLIAIEQAVWNTGHKYDLWVYEYNLYGDPKFGGISSSPSTAPAADGSVDALFATVVLTEPLPTLDVVVPDYQVNSVGALDYVDIPGGLWWLEEGMPEVPIYPVWVEIPEGYKVQGVSIAGRGGLTETTGLNLPLASMEADCGVGCSQLSITAGEVEWMPNGDFGWSTVENPDGSSSLLITIYPFYYNMLTTDVAFYTDYHFEIVYAPSSVEVTNLTMGSEAYALGDAVMVDIGLRNTGQVQDVVVSAVVSLHGSGAPAGSLMLSTLDAVTGTASFSPVWDSSGAVAGLYDVEVTLRSADGNLLDRESQMFQLGASVGEIVAFTATPGEFDIGDTIDITMIFSNTGTSEITGTAFIRVLDEDGWTVQEFADEIDGLAPGHSVTIGHGWDTTGEPRGTYGIVGYVTYDGLATDPMVVTVTTKEWPIYLPLIMRNAP